MWSLVLPVVMATVVSAGGGARVVSGQTLCIGRSERRCYKVAYFHDVSSRVAFWEASEACGTDGGELLSIESEEEQREVQELLEELRSGSGGGISDGDFWIGLSRSDGPDGIASCPQSYRWTDGSPATFRKWYLDEPSCGGEACVVMYHQPAARPGLGGAYLYTWNDDRCNMKHNFICKYQSERHLLEEDGVSEGRDTEPALGEGGATEDTPPQMPAPGAPGTLLLYIVIPTIPLLLLLLVAALSCCVQTLSGSSRRAKTTVGAPNLWISRAPRAERIAV
ncbi:chondrolectin [Synchiropus splendidus]|uniref:chondrolectin n=1 Tax=Synchiropus splendidus TaxID=270530 RepID=UPI00237E7997|nr:chondrolectin [Synchiropus splendidus]